MKRPALKLKLAVLCLLPILAFSQPKLPVTNNDLRNALQKVLSDYPNHFSGIKGEVLHENPQTVEYGTLLEFKTAEENTITKYISPRSIYSWQAVMLTTEEYEEARKKYRWLYDQLRVMTVNLDNGYSYSLSGRFEEPAESRKFSGSVFTLTPASSGHPKVKVEITMQFYFPEWKVGISVYEKEREDSERGPLKEKDI
ncbi:MAG TPA: hypothetical protein VFZ78_00180 [Flavisolibacter sp.]